MKSLLYLVWVLHLSLLLTYCAAEAEDSLPRGPEVSASSPRAPEVNESVPGGLDDGSTLLRGEPEASDSGPRGLESVSGSLLACPAENCFNLTVTCMKGTQC
jgi:hypothetical protein